jgi:RNA polymerase sigma factor (sigma-70 family)
LELNISSLFPGKTRWDEADFNRTFLEHYSKMCAVAFRIVHDPDEAEDIASAAFWQLWSAPPAQSHNLVGWLYRVTTRLAYNHIRAQRRRSRYESQVDGGIHVDTPSSEEQARRRERRERIRSVLRQLPARDVQLLALRSDGLSYAAIAEALRLNRNSIGTQLARAEKRFAQLYRKAEADALER